MQRLLDVLCPKIESQLKSWSSCIPDDGCSVIGEHLNNVKVMLRAKFRSYRQALVEKLADNVRNKLNFLSNFFFFFPVNFQCLFAEEKSFEKLELE